MVPGPDGQDASATVLEKNVGKDEAGEYCMAVRFANGEEGLIRHASVMAKSSDTASSEDDLLKNFTSRAPRPVLHLLRLPDLMNAEREAQRMPKRPRFQKEAQEIEDELDREATEEARVAFQRGKIRSKGDAGVTGSATGQSRKRIEAKTRESNDGEKRTEELQELAEMRGATEGITDRNEFTINTLGRLRLMEIMENCEDE
eukprot:Skav214489  [mRNA]  locus=scaffold1011:76711:77316:- [translate_table: standard]